MVSTSPLTSLGFLTLCFLSGGVDITVYVFGELAVASIEESGSVYVGRLASFVVGSLPCTLA